MRVRVGTSGFSYPPWRGRFYPERLPAAEMLAYYAGRFETVEINNTFYRLPSPDLLSRWAAQVPPHFAFGFKAPRRITHTARLSGAGDVLAEFLQRLQLVGERLGPVLFQLPPTAKADLPRLADFLELLPPALRAAFEFRHESWFAEPVLRALSDRGQALCIAESEDLAVPVEATAPWGYLRLRRLDYGPRELAAWSERIAAQPWSEAFVYFKHEDEALGPRFAQQFASLAGAASAAGAPA